MEGALPIRLGLSEFDGSNLNESFCAAEEAQWSENWLNTMDAIITPCIHWDGKLQNKHQEEWREPNQFLECNTFEQMFKMKFTTARSTIKS